MTNNENKLLQWAFWIGGLYDIGVGLTALVFADLLIPLLGIANPMPRIWVQLSGLFLLAVGYMLVVAARQGASQYIFIGVGSVFVRFGYAAVVLLTLLTTGIELAYILGALTDALTGLLILVAIWKAGELQRKNII